VFNFGTIEEKDARTLNPQVLAFVGDGVYSLYIRHKIVLDGNLKGEKLHNEVTRFVKARGQSTFLDRLLPIFTEVEMSVFKRARNHKTLSQAKNASIVDYRRATGLEAVIGYLYLTHQMDRLNQILEMSVGESNEN
jgi:ribonuclease-3 family protein